MFCPNCGSDERHTGQYCRTCGTDLRGVRAGLENPNARPTAVLTAREEIARAVAYKITQLDKGKDLAKVAEEVLPELEKFLESPQQRRLRRIRAGVITSAVGLGGTLFFILMAVMSREEELLAMMALGVTAFLIGLGIIINAKWFTVLPEHEQPRELPDAMQQFLAQPVANTNELPPYRTPVTSVTEHTTHHLPAPETLRRN
jgi:hypothetical protein